MKKDRIKLDEVRYFDPLIKSRTEPDLVIHIPVCLELIESRNPDSGNRDMAALKISLEHLINMPISKEPISIDFVISVNGFIQYDEKYIDYLEGLQDTDNYTFKIFQRPNFGWQWGSMYDVWLAYKDTKTQWFFTSECDLKMTKEYWFDYLRPFFDRGKVGHVGMFCREKIIGLEGAYGSVDKIPTRLWRTASNEIKEMRTSDTLHTNGEWYLFHRNVLRDMEETFGCFSYSMGVDRCMDGVLMGEVGICQKELVLGYEFFAEEMQEKLLQPS